ncbi:origin recognition complex subunit 1 isoform X1 [Tachysurus vachellii]|uniref:origin recognition complex subunit 1 isoform X1 n=1 Tax=Tachysurus vachellii TaxID=175792 RepID=UPI00296AE33C|nr:origin recognition complex subunit 1 isoform X1 [Tachysurus vachellii]XP_060723515.1 origin recognition complex subunit 1 isoform X1 [Tachysurus vachellii]
MSRYFTRLRVRRTYTWSGNPISEDRKLKKFYYECLSVSTEGKVDDTVVSVGQCILIEGENDDSPFVAKLLKLFSDDSGKQKKAVVQWFVRMCEIPQNKRKLLGRDAHPQEIFYYQDRSCDNEVDAETILGTVQIQHVPAKDPFPDDKNKNTLFVKLQWDTKNFQVLDPELMKPPQSPKSPPPARHAPRLRALPTPDPSVIKRAMSGVNTRGSMSTGKMGSTGAESAHSASKLSAAKLLNVKRRGRVSSNPNIRKKLDLCSPTKKLSRDGVLGETSDDDQETEEVLASKLAASPPRRISISIRLTPLPKIISNKTCTERDNLSIRPLQSPDRPDHSACDDTSNRDLLGVEPLEDDVFEAEALIGKGRTPRRREATPRRAGLRGHNSRTPSRKRESASGREPALAVLAEEEHEDSPAQTTATPRSKRKSAQLVSSLIRKQLSDELQSDGEDADDDGCFVPSKLDLESSSEEEEETKMDSEDELVVKRTRRSAGPRTPSTEKTRASARTPRKTPNKKSAPHTPRTPRHATPSIPSRSLPARKPGNVLEEARARLHVSSVPESLPCREQEFQDIYNFVESKIMDGTGGCMYISGVPGTGKTATVHEVIRSLQQAAEQEEITPFRFIEINGMKMTDPHQAYVQILQKLTDQKATPDHAAALLEKRFSTPAPKKETTVLLVDELDLLWTRKQNVMYNIFDWPTRRHARLVVLTIANTMDLPERIMINRVASRLGLTRMSFQPYTFKQLQQIITSRLNRVKAFEEDALQLVSRKVAALSGDARRCLDICRRATEICEHADQKGAVGLVGMSHVMEALDEMFSSSYVTAIRCSSLQEQLFLRAVIAEFRRLGLEEATFQQVFVQHQALCRVEGLQPASVSESLAVCQRLGACRLLLLEPSRLDLLLRVRLNLSQDDVLYALKGD